VADPTQQHRQQIRHRLIIGGILATVLSALLALALIMAVVILPVLFVGQLIGSGQVTRQGKLVHGAGAPVGSGPIKLGPPVHLGPVNPPASIVTLDEAVSAATTGVSCHVPASLLLAQQFIESSYNPRAVGPKTRYGHARGMSQFLLSTFHEYDHPPPPGGANPPSVYNPVDAAWAEARMLCADGWATNPVGALWHYNHSYSYGQEILGLARQIAGAKAPSPTLHL